MYTTRKLKDDPVLDEIKSRLPVYELVRDSVAGRTHCPLSDCPSYGTGKYETQLNEIFWYCHICKRSGDVFDWVMNNERVEFLEARKILADRLGICLSPSKERLEILRRFAIRANEYLLSRPDKLAYLERRALTTQTVFKYQIGYVDTENEVLSSCGLTKEDLARVGLLYPPEGTQPELSAMAGRYIFPIRDVAGRLVQLKGRADPEVLPDEKRKSIPLAKAPRSAPASWGQYSHMNHLYLEELLPAAQKAGYVIVTEGEPDTLTLRQLGFHAVGLQTSQGMSRHAHKLRGIGRVYLMLDNDLVSKRSIVKELYELQIKLPESRVFRTCIPDYEGYKKVDVNDYVAKLGKTRADLRELLVASETAYDVIIREWGPHYKDRVMFDHLARLICITTGDQRQTLLKKFAEATGRRVDLLAFAVDPGGYNETGS